MAGKYARANGAIDRNALDSRAAEISRSLRAYSQWRFRVLGPVQVESTGSAGRQIPLNSHRKRAILALLLVNLGKTVSSDRLIDAIWADASPPATAREQVQNCTAELRRAMHFSAAGSASGRAVKVVTHPDGYRLDADPRTCDVWLFEELLAESLRTPAEHDHEATAALRSALGLWTGSALGGLPAPELLAEAARLEELRMIAIEELACRELRCGKLPAMHAAELLALTLRHPYRERLWLLHMDALHRCGRSAEALARFREYRTMLVAEHGVEPGPEIRAKHQEILRRSS